MANTSYKYGVVSGSGANREDIRGTRRTSPRVRAAMRHRDEPGEGAKKRKHLRGKEKVSVVMKEFKRGTLHSGSGEKVKKRSQAVAIALSEAGLSKKKKGK